MNFSSALGVDRVVRTSSLCGTFVTIFMLAMAAGAARGKLWVGAQPLGMGQKFCGRAISNVRLP